MVIVNDHYQSIGIVCLSVSNQGAFNVSRVGGRSGLISSFSILVLSLKYRSHYQLKLKVKFSHTRYRALGPELIPVYRQSAHR